ncbi:MAG: hypothetical protein RL172_2567 [Bacteroidota bacterium]|jgi:formyltetrahydrofolate-dependent phosphoribosylglycinamide formyltransferase
MLEQLKKRWKVNTISLVLIICTFALGGSLCGYLGRKLLSLLEIDRGSLWLFAYIAVMTLIWPFCVLLISIPFGQYYFFKNYLTRIWAKLNRNKQQPASIILFASGAGSNAQKIIDHFRSNQSVSVSLIVCNKPGAGVLSIAAKENIPSLIIEKEQFFRGDHYLPILNQYKPDLIVLAGFLWKIPAGLINAYPGKIINIHPALLPKYGGKGMYGQFVHQAVIDAGEKESGITIHYVDELYDHGAVILQERCAVTAEDTALTLAEKVHQLEHTHFPLVVEQILKGQKAVKNSNA